MKKRIKFLLLLFLIYPMISYAEEIEVNRKGSIKINDMYGTTPIAGSTIDIYQVANMDHRGEFTYTNHYSLEDSLVVESSSQWGDLAKKIYDYTIQNHISKISSCQTNEDGKCEMTNLDVGLYLITSSSVTKDNYQYSTSPILVSLPNYNELEHLMTYDIDTFLKVESQLIKVENEDKPTSIVPKTIDSIYSYIIIFVLSIIVIIVVSLYIKRIGKKEERNEKNN